MATLRLPTRRIALAAYTDPDAPLARPKRRGRRSFNRVAYAAAHVVADPLADNDPWLDAAIDWDTTIAFRDYLWDLGLRRRRGDGHRAARHGARLAERAGADPPRARGRARAGPAR